jgi:hypothetical protein
LSLSKPGSGLRAAAFRTWLAIDGSIDGATALSDANALAGGTCGLSDGSVAGQWRLPNVNELHSLSDLAHYNPALPAGHPFTGVQFWYYWTSTTVAGLTSAAWNVEQGSGYVNASNKTATYYVWPVRGGQ